MGSGITILQTLVSAALLWIVLRLFAKDEADLSPARYPIFGAVYWFAMWMGTTALQWGIWTLIPLTIFTIFALCQFFYLTIAKSIWLGVVFVVLRSLLDFAIAVGQERIIESVR